MKQFLKYFFAAVLAIVFMTFLFFASLMMIGALADQEVSIEAKTILKLDLNAPIVDRATPNPLDKLSGSFGAGSTLGLSTILKGIKKAETDENIAGILLDISMLQAGMATVEEIRDALIEFKTNSNKFIISYSEIYSQKALYLSSVATSSYVFPEGLVEFRGLRSTRTFMKGTLEKLEIEAQIIRHGKFKSAIEPLILEKMSEANKEQTMTYVSDLWKHMVKGIGEERNISTAELENIADELMIREAEDAVKYKLMDATIYKDELLDTLKSLTGIPSDEKLEVISINKYDKVKGGNKKIIKNKIAVIYAFGDIVSGKGDKESMGSETISKQIRKAREDEKVKAIVLRVNSPGGSALASDVIWREVKLARASKPVVVSMGDVAASGGYYIACEADKIFASENTITGSIGVFGVIPNMKGLFENKLGLTFDGVQTSKFADLGALYRPLTAAERDIIQMGVEKIYDDFIEKVGEGRSIDKAQVDSIGQGRVWSGEDAMDIGLIDEFGGLNAAIKEAVKLANIEEYKLMELPKEKEPVQQLMEDLFGSSRETKILKQHLGSSYKYFEYLQSVSKLNGIQMKMPYFLEIE